MPIQPFFNRYSYHLLLLLLALLWIGLFDFLMQGHWQTFVSYDARSYRESAENLYLHLRGHNYRLMLMAAITGIPYLFGASENTFYVFGDWVNLFCWLGSLVLLLEILNHFAKPKLAFLLALISVFIVGINAVVFEMATENIYLFFILFSFYFLTRYYKTEQFKFLCFALAFLVLSMLIKPGSKFFAITLTLFYIKPIIFNYASKYSWLIYGSYLLVLIQCAGIKHQFGNFTLGYVDAVTYYDYLGAKAEALQTKRPFKEVWLARATYIYSHSCPEQKEIASKDLTHQLQTNTANFIKAFGLNLVENATTGSVQIELMQNVKQIDYFSTIKTLVYSITKWQNRVGSLTAFLLALWSVLRFRKQESLFAIVGGFVLYTILLSGVSCSEGDRFNMITFPLAVLLLGKLIVEKKKGFRQRLNRTLYDFKNLMVFAF